MTKKILGILSVAILFVTSCAKDMDVDEDRRNKMLEEAQRLKAVTGIYRGVVRREATNEWIGGLEVDLAIDAEAQRNPDNYRNEEISILLMHLTLEMEDEGLAAEFSKVSYQSDSSTLRGTLQVPQKEGGMKRLNFVAAVSGNTIMGTLSVPGKRKNQGTFVLVRDGEMPKPEKSDVLPDLWMDEKLFVGTGSFPHLGNRAVLLSLISDSVSDEEELLLMFSSTKNLKVSLGLTENLNLVFEEVEWDPDTRTLTGVSNFTTGSTFGSVRVKLECTEKLRGKSFDCSVGNSTRRERIKLSVKLSNQAPGLGNFRRDLKYASVTKDGYRHTLHLETLEDSGASDFVQIFNYVRPVRFDMSVYTAPVSFESGIWYLDAGRLVGKSSFVHPDQGAQENRVDCRSTYESKMLIWNCAYYSTINGSTLKFRFAPEKKL